MLWIIGFCATITRMPTIENTEFQYFFWWLSRFLFHISTLNVSMNGNSKAHQPYYFLKEINMIFQAHLNILPKLWLIFGRQQQKLQKLGHFGYFNDHNSWNTTLDSQTNEPIFLIYLLSFFRWYISFLHFKSSKVNFMGSSIHSRLWSVKYTFTSKRWHFQAC